MSSWDLQSILKLTIDSFLHTYSPFVPVCSELQFFPTSRLGNYLNCGSYKKKKKSPDWIMLKFHKNETGEAQRRLCPLPGECMSQDPFCQTQGTIPRPGYTGLIQVCFFHSHYFEDLQSQTKDTKSRRETTVLVGNTTKAVCVRWETETTMQTRLFCLGCPGASLASLPQNVISFFSDATRRQSEVLQSRSWIVELESSHRDVHILQVALT